METYSKENDYELVALAKEGNEWAINILYKKYKPIVVSKSNFFISKIKYSGIEISDVMQEGFIGFDEAINDFCEENDVSFYTFAVMCIDRKILNYVRSVATKKYKVLNDAVPIDDYIEKQVKDDFDLESFCLSRERKRMLKEVVDKKFTIFEKEVIKLLYKGYNYEEIANTLNKSIKSVYNSVNRIKNKIDFDKDNSYL